ncbi:MAG: Ig-like domain-containing protein [Gemmatimonadota bacterium]
MGALSAFVLAGALQAAAGAAAPPDSVVVSPGAFELAVDDSHAMRVEVYDADGDRVANPSVRWVASDADVLSVDTEGVVTALRPGTAQVLAVVGGEVGYAEVTVPQLPPAAIEIEVPVDAVPAGASAPLDVTVRTRIGDVLQASGVRFRSDDEEVAGVDATGRVYGRSPGETVVYAFAGDAEAAARVRVAPKTADSYELVTPEYTVRTGDVVRLRVRAEDGSGGEVDGIRPLWAVAGPGARIEEERGEGVFVASEPGRYPVSATIGEGTVRTTVVEVVERPTPAEIELVGRGPIEAHNSGDMWVFEGEDGRDYVYIGTFMYDWMKVWDVTDPSNPVLTDSVQVDARRINDVKIHPNRRLGLITREGASDRRNGIVLLDLGDPAHPTILSEYTETVSGGVHNVWIDGENELVYACHNGTSDMHIIDISDPRAPREVGRWGLDKERKTLHDVIVQDGYAYLSYWDDGLVILDVGAGTHDGTPTEPAFVSRYSYPQGHTHVAWRHGRYVFVGDEIFPTEWDPSRPIEARGYVHVLDVSDIDHPVEVAKYEVPEAGAHNVWVDDDDRLYVGYYQAGLRVVDVSGELRGDLYEQGREIANFPMIDARSVVPNWPMTWGAQIFKGRIYSSDMNSGLWITRLTPPDPVS